MRKLVATEYLTLDGVMEEPGQWSFPFWNAEAAQFKFDELFASDALLLGRLTYQGFAQAWPTMTDEMGFADRMNSLPKYVVSNTLQTVDEWNNSHLITGDVAQKVSKLKEQPGQDILIGGSGQLVRALMPYGLIDEYRFMLYPLIRGQGKRLFTDGLDTQTLKLVSTTTTSAGTVILTYQRQDDDHRDANGQR